MIVKLLMLLLLLLFGRPRVEANDREVAATKFPTFEEERDVLAKASLGVRLENLQLSGLQLKSLLVVSGKEVLLFFSFSFAFSFSSNPL